LAQAATPITTREKASPLSERAAKYSGFRAF
jgi:hypothetical protein